MRKETLLISLLAFIIIAAGCQKGDAGAAAGTAFIGGTSAVRMSFLANAPPAEVTDNPTEKAGQGFQFNAIVTVENVGEQAIDQRDMKVKLIGFDPADFGTTPAALQTSPDRDLNGVRKDPEGNRIQGDLAQLTFPTQGKLEYQKKLKGGQSFPIWAEACYLYTTKTISQMCILDDLTKPERTVCSPTGSKQVSNSGAPVQVTSVTQGVGGKDKLLLTFNVRKVGTSDVFKLPDTSAANNCADTFDNKDRVYVTVDTGAELGKTLDCFGLLNPGADKVNGDLLLTNGQASFTCIQTIPAGSIDSIKSYDITLDYYARDTIKTNVLVKSLLTE